MPLRFFKIIFLSYVSFVSVFSFSETSYVSGLTIEKIRAVGNYHAGDTYDNTIELWFSEAIDWPEGSLCEVGFRAYIDASNEHMVSLAYVAFISGKLVNINAMKV